MQRRLWLLAPLALLVLALLWPPPPQDVPTPSDQPAPAMAPPPKPAHPPRARVVLHRPAVAPPPPSAAPAPPVEAVPVRPPEPRFDDPWTLDDLPDDDRQRLGRQALDQLGELQDRCGRDHLEATAYVSLTMTVDDLGLFELDVASYDAEQQLIVEGVPLPDALIDCLDDVVWDMDWPTWDAPLSFALTTPFEPDQAEDHAED